jgi:hypothetical protein
MPVDPDVNRNFAIVSGPTRSCAASSAGVTGRSGSDRLAKRAAVRGEHQARRHQLEDVAQLAEVRGRE